MKYFIQHDDLKPRQLFPGISATLAHSEDITISRVNIDAGSDLPEHAHHQEQWTHLISGELEMTIGDETSLMLPGMSAFIPSNVLHSGKAITNCIVLDVFTPHRADLK